MSTAPEPFGADATEPTPPTSLPEPPTPLPEPPTPITERPTPIPEPPTPEPPTSPPTTPTFDPTGRPTRDYPDPPPLQRRRVRVVAGGPAGGVEGRRGGQRSRGLRSWRFWNRSWPFRNRSWRFRERSWRFRERGRRRRLGGVGSKRFRSGRHVHELKRLSGRPGSGSTLGRSEICWQPLPRSTASSAAYPAYGAGCHSGA